MNQHLLKQINEVLATGMTQQEVRNGDTALRDRTFDSFDSGHCCHFLAFSKIIPQNTNHTTFAADLLLHIGTGKNTSTFAAIFSGIPALYVI